jgi:hypothetical protein
MIMNWRKTVSRENGKYDSLVARAYQEEEFRASVIFSDIIDDRRCWVLRVEIRKYFCMTVDVDDVLELEGFVRERFRSRLPLGDG